MSISTPQIMYVNKNLNLKNNDSLQKTWQTFWVQQSALHDWLEDFLIQIIKMVPVAWGNTEQEELDVVGTQHITGQ